jgi:excisionase family DNA binding protein
MEPSRSGWLSANQACRRLRMSRATLLRLVNRGELPAYRIGWMIRLLVDDVEAYRRRLAGEEEPGPPAD